MMRAVGLVMIVLGGLGIGVSLVDWQAIGVFQAAGDVQQENEGKADEGGVELTTGQTEPGEGVTKAALENGPVATQPNGPSSKPAASDVVAERDPANVRVFEPDDRSSDDTTTLWADISTASDVVREDSGHASFLVTLSEPAERSVVIIFSTVDLSANDQEDYRSQRGTVTFEPGVVSAEIQTPLIDDDIEEDDEQFAIVLNGAPGIVNFKSRRITTTIEDDD